LDYIIQNKIDQPFGLRYQNDDRPEKTYPLVQVTNHEYAGSGIWSYWGMEYIKALKITANGMQDGGLKANISDSTVQNSKLKIQNSDSQSKISQNTTPQNSATTNVEGENEQKIIEKAQKYNQTAEYQIQKYNQNIQKYKAFPEVYNSRGELMSEWMYRSVVKTGWIVGFRQSLEVK
jgi:hypothetical protein